MSTLRPICHSTMLLLALGACSSETGPGMATRASVPQAITSQRVQDVSAIMADRLDMMLVKLHPIAGN